MPRVPWRSQLSRLLRSLADVVDPPPAGLDLDGAPRVWADHVRAAAARNRRESLRVAGTRGRLRPPGFERSRPGAAAAHPASPARTRPDGLPADQIGSAPARPAPKPSEAAGQPDRTPRADRTPHADDRTPQADRPGRARPTLRPWWPRRAAAPRSVGATATPVNPEQPEVRTGIAPPPIPGMPLVLPRPDAGSARAPLVRPGRSAMEPPPGDPRAAARRPADAEAAADGRSAGVTLPLSATPAPGVREALQAHRPAPVLPPRAREGRPRLLLPVPVTGATQSPGPDEHVGATTPPRHRVGDPVPTPTPSGDQFGESLPNRTPRPDWPSQARPRRTPEPDPVRDPLPAPAVPIELLWPDLPVRPQPPAGSTPALETTLTRLTRLAAEQAAI